MSVNECFNNVGYQECYNNSDCMTQCNYYCSEVGHDSNISYTCNNNNNCDCCCTTPSGGSNPYSGTGRISKSQMRRKTRKVVTGLRRKNPLVSLFPGKAYKRGRRSLMISLIRRFLRTQKKSALPGSTEILRRISNSKQLSNNRQF